MQNDITNARHVIKMANECKEIRVWMPWAERHVKVVKSDFLLQMRTIRDGISNGEILNSLWAEMDEEGTLWVD